MRGASVPVLYRDSVSRRFGDEWFVIVATSAQFTGPSDVYTAGPGDRLIKGELTLKGTLCSRSKSQFVKAMAGCLEAGELLLV